LVLVLGGGFWGVLGVAVCQLFSPVARAGPFRGPTPDRGFFAAPFERPEYCAGHEPAQVVRSDGERR